MESETRRREREMAEHQQRMDKISLLQKSLEEAKAQVKHVFSIDSVHTNIFCSGAS